MRTIKYFINERGKNEPDKIYAIAPEPGLSLSYEHLQKDSIRFGKYLAKMGLKKGDKVSFMLANGYQAAKIFLGTMYGGFVVAPLNLLAQPSQLAYVLEHSDTKVVFYSKDQKERLTTAAAKVARNIKLIEIDNDSENIVPENEDFTDISLPEVAEEDDALLLYTSGTTGVPKGVILSHKNMVAGGEYTTLAHELSNASVTYTFIASLVLAQIAMCVFGIILSRYSYMVMSVPNLFMIAAVTILAVYGTYSVQNSFDDVIVMFSLGTLMYIGRKFGFSPAPVVLGIILGPIAEDIHYIFYRKLIGD